MTQQNSLTLPVLQQELQQLLQLIQTTVNQQVESSSEGLRALEVKLKKLDNQIVIKQDELDRIVEQTDSAKVEIGALEHTISKQTEKNKQLLEEHKDLSIRATVIAQNIKQSQDAEKMVRKDLAIRIMAADERDKNLKIRELKVAQVEERVQANVGLLGL